VWASADGVVRNLPGRGIALGVVDNAEYQEEEVRLAPGDSLVLYTDGLTETVNGRVEEFGLRRVQEVVLSTRHLPAPAILETLAAEVAEHADGMEPFDDLTIVVLKRLSGSAILAGGKEGT